MKKTVISLVALGAVLFTACGPSAEEKARIEKERNDSIARVEAEALAAKVEAERRDSIERAEKRKARWASDSVEITKLLPHFVITKDKELESKRVFVAKGVPTSHYRNAAYLSFTTMGDKADALYLNVDITGQHQILLSYATVIIGDDTYNVNSIGDSQLNTDRYPSMAEWMYGEVSSSLMDKILGAETVKIKAVGSDGDKLITISSADLKKMKETIELYKLFKNSKVITE